MDLMPRYIKYPRTIDATVIQNSRIVLSFLWVDMRSIANLRLFVHDCGWISAA